MSDLSSFAGKYAIITGSTQGLGEATARLFAERGAAGIIITGRNQERGAAVVAALTSQGCAAHFVPAELAEIDDCRRIIAAAEAHFGALHVLVNAAAATARSTIWDTTVELWDQTLAINLRAPYFLIQGAVKLMANAGVAGSIVNISSVAAHGSVPFLAPYAISKGGLNILTKNVAYAVMRHRIRVNALNLGWMDTPAEDTIQRQYHSNGQDWLAAAEAAQPFGRLLKTDEVARAIAYLASDESGLMTGAVIDFDQSVIGAGPQPIPPPMAEWPAVAGVAYE
ncbi:MAG: SDR family oxidoreductase [Caldilineaceae bacterium]|nr:SDR family oxidoreductase [Caldilineaceae bacterium]